MDIDNILLMAETRNTDEMRNSATDELLSQFKVNKRSFLLCEHVFTAWAVALSCYISHGAMHRKKADFDPSGGQNP